MQLQNFGIKCYICNKKYDGFSGIENWSILRKSEILSMCESCSKMIAEQIEFYKQMYSGEFRCPADDTLMKKLDKHSWTCQKCRITFSKG